MDRSEAKGQYFLTGSQNFSVLRTIAESMAGRVGIFHLENLTPQECIGAGATDPWISSYLENPNSFYQERPLLPPTFPSLIEFLFRGTLPEPLTFPLTQMPRYFRSYLQTYIDRDVRLQEDIRHLAEFGRFLAVSAALTAQEINSSQLGRDIGVSPQTARRWLDLLSFSYQWMELPPFHGNAIKRLSGKKKGYFIYTGFACFLQKIDSPDSLIANPRLGSIFETWAINYIHQQCSVLPIPPSMYHWRTAGGAEVDLVLEHRGELYPIEVKCKTNLTRADLSGLRAFRQTYENVNPGLVIYAGTESYKLDDSTLAIPWSLI